MVMIDIGILLAWGGFLLFTGTVRVHAFKRGLKYGLYTCVIPLYAWWWAITKYESKYRIPILVVAITAFVGGLAMYSVGKYNYYLAKGIRTEVFSNVQDIRRMQNRFHSESLKGSNTEHFAENIETLGWQLPEGGIIGSGRGRYKYGTGAEGGGWAIAQDPAALSHLPSRIIRPFIIFKYTDIDPYDPYVDESEMNAYLSRMGSHVEQRKYNEAKTAKGEAGILAMKKYLNDYPDGKYVSEARTELSVYEDRLACMKTRTKKTKEAWIAYLKTFSKGICVEEAKDRISGQDPDKYGIEWVSIPAGSYMMGCSPDGSYCNRIGGRRHREDIKAFSIMRYEVTQGQYSTIMGKNPSSFNKCGKKCPIDKIDWHGAKLLCKKIRGRLPTGAEWEYAARAGTETAIYGDIDFIAWYLSNSDGTVHPVGLKQPNQWGLYDMLGNVSEWTQDCYQHKNDRSRKCKLRLVRGGSWSDAMRQQSASYLFRQKPDSDYNAIGFRCARDQ